MIQKIVINKIFINSEKNGKPLLNKKNEPYKMCVIENGLGKKASMYIGMFAGAWDKKLDIVSKWKAGDEVEVSLEQQGEYLNFNLPTNENKLEARIVVLEKAVFKAPTKARNPQPVSFATNHIETPHNASYSPEDDIQPEDLPFL